MPEDSNIERALGVVIGKLDGIEGRLDRQDESRAVLHKRLDDLILRTTHLETDMHSAKNRLDAHEKVTEEVTALRTKAEGAGTLGRWLLRLGIGIITVAGWLIALYSQITGRPPP